MLTFYRNDDCPACDSVAETLAETTLAHKVVAPGEIDAEKQPPGGAEPPVLVEDGQSFAGHDAIRRRLDELEDIAADWSRYQSDACYCDDEGNPL